jgi:hypothetical protein
VYIASQDNPEQGLCHHPSADRPIPQMNTASKPKKRANGSVKPPGNEEGLPGQEHRVDNKSRAASAGELHLLGSNMMEMMNKNKSPKDEKPTGTLADPLRGLDEPTTTDHRSFVQNVFGTTAFKMLEWLTPRSLEILTRPEEIAQLVKKEAPKSLPRDLVNPQSGNRKEQSEVAFAEISSAKDRIMHEPGPVKVENEAPSPRPKPLITNAKASPVSPDSKPPSNPAPKRTSSLNRRKKLESVENQPPKGILNIPSRTSDPSIDMTLPQFRPSNPKQKMSRQSSITSPQLHVAEITSITAGKPTSIKIITEPKRATRKDEDDPREEIVPSSGVNVEKIAPKTKASDLHSFKSPSSPQSMSYRPIELIEFLCDVLHTDRTAEKHDLEPIAVDDKTVKMQDRPCPYGKPRDPGLSGPDPTAHKERWRSFIEQSFFDVLSKPDSLFRSFSDSDGQLFDTHTMWYLLLRMTRVAPSIVFHSLWNAAGVLFNLPENLETIYDWAKEPHNSLSSKSLSNQDAAKVVSICLHALVAAAPLVSNARQLANMSRIRSYGLTMLGREKSSLEPAELCLAYEDAFTNELALRLARRLFASIPTRRRFTELMEVQNDVRNDGERELDVLEAVLAKLKFLDLETTPVLSFELDERDLHEKRVPTLLLDWARTVMLQDWQGSAEVSAEGAFGGALALIAAICM